MTPQRRLRERWKGQRQSTNIEDRRGMKLPGVSPSDSAGMARGTPDINASVTRGFENDVTRVQVEKARGDLGRAYLSRLAPYSPNRSLRHTRLPKKRS